MNVLHYTLPSIFFVAQLLGTVDSRASESMVETAVSGDSAELSPEELGELDLVVQDALSGVPAVVQSAKALPSGAEELLSSPQVGLRARVWVVANARFFDLYVADTQQYRVLIRRLDAKGRSFAVRNEELSQVLRAVVSALLEGGTIGVSYPVPAEVVELAGDDPPEAEPLEVEPPLQEAVEKPPAAAPQAKLELVPALRYEAVGYSDEQPILSRYGVAVLAAAAPKELEWGASFTLLFAPSALDTDEVSARLDSLLARAVADLRPGWQGHWRWQVGLGAGFETVFIAPTTSSSGGDATDPRVAVFGHVHAEGGLEWRISRTRIGLNLYADVPLTDIDYVVESEGSEESVLNPWPVNPGLGLQIGFQ